MVSDYLAGAVLQCSTSMQKVPSAGSFGAAYPNHAICTRAVLGRRKTHPSHAHGLSAPELAKEELS
eukprot:4431561-Amphidinium_carterae.1